MISELLTSVAALSVALCASSAAQAAPAKNIVLVHGAYADGSGWKAVSEILTRDGYRVSVVQEPETSLEDDVAATKRILALQDGPTILVGHSYGGVIVTDAGDDPHVQGLVYIAAFMPDSGELLRTLGSRFAPASNHVVQLGDGFQMLDPTTFAQDFAADLPADQSAYMAISQVPTNIKALSTPVVQAAWRSKPTWYAVATMDHKINPDLERYMAKRAGSTTVEIKGSHAIYASQPKAVAKLIEEAAKNSGS